MDIKVIRKGQGGANTLVYLDGKLCKEAVSIGWSTGVDELVDTVVLELLCTNFSVDIIEGEDEYLKKCEQLKIKNAQTKAVDSEESWLYDIGPEKEE